MMQAKFVKDTAITEDLYEHEFLIQGTALFEAGQYQTIVFDDDCKAGPFSILSSPRDLPFVKFLSRRKLNLTPGQLVKLTQAQGEMIRVEKVQKYCLIAGGTGLAPFISLISTHSQIHFELTWSYKKESDLQLIATYLSKAENLTLKTHLFDGHNLATLLNELNLDPQAHYYLAGPYVFVEKVGQYLQSQQISSLVSDMKRF